MNDADLIRELQRRKNAALELLMRRYGRLLWTVAAGILRDSGTPEDAEEVVADVFVELWQRPEQFDPGRSSLRSFLCMKTRSRAIDRLRSLCRRPELPMEQAPEPSTDDLQRALLGSCTVERIRQMLEALPPPDRQVMTLRLLYELKPAEIAAKLELPVREIYDRIRKGKTQLRAALRQEGYDE